MSSAVPLTQAVTSGDTSAVSAALASGADVNERNNGGQTALILAVIFGHTKLVRLLVKSGANPRLRDNLGLDAIEWAQRRGFTEALEIFGNKTSEPEPVTQTRVEPPPLQAETQTDPDEKSRKWLAGLKQRIQEQSNKQIHVPEPVVEPITVAAPEPVRELVPEPVLESVAEPISEPVPEPTSPTSATRKRCPKCNAIYNSELVAYCAHHFVRLVDEDEPLFEPPPSLTTTITSSPLLWMFVLATVSIAAFTGYMITSQLSRVVIPDSATAAQEPRGFLKGTPIAAGELAGKAVTLAEAECPIFDGESRAKTNAAAQTVNVHVKLDKAGKVYWARAEGGDEALRTAATEAATQSTFSPDKLHGRETEGTITYTFTQ
jgi:hypothetical protein